MINKIKQLEWEKYWSANISLSTCNYLGHCYTAELQKHLDFNFENVIFIHKEGMSVCYFTPEDRKKFGNHLIEKFAKEVGFIEKFCKELKSRTNIFLDFFKKEEKTFNRDYFLQYLDHLFGYTSFHIGPRHIVDFLSPEKQGEYLNYLTDARLHSEKTYEEVEKFMLRFGRQIENKFGIPIHLSLCLLKEEIEKYLEEGKFSTTKAELEERYQKSALLFFDGKVILETGKNVDLIEKELNQLKTKDFVSGVVAYPGKIVGKTKIVLDPRKVSNFCENDILIAGMTRPEYLPLMKKAGAIVTDSGGLLCHAAIVAREIKKPCVIGTKNATQIFKDGDLVEVDANRGEIKKIK